MKTLIALVAGTGPLLASGVAWAQNGNMMNGSGWGMGSMDGYGGIWGPVLLVVAIVAVVALVMQRKRKLTVASKKSCLACCNAIANLSLPPL